MSPIPSERMLGSQPPPTRREQFVAGLQKRVDRFSWGSFVVGVVVSSIVDFVQTFLVR